MRSAIPAVCLFLTLVAFAPAGEDPNVFRSVTVGFEVVKPSSWHFVTAEQNLESLKQTKLNDKEFHKLMLNYAKAPLVAIMKYPEPFDDLNPSFKVNIRPLGQMKGADPREILVMLSGQFKKILKDYRAEMSPVVTLVAGLPTGYLRAHYTLETNEGRSFAVTSELWIVPRGDYFFMIGAGTRQDEATGSRREIREILKTIRITSREGP